MADAPEEIDQLAELAGFYMAHAVWCIADGEVLCPLIGYEATRWPRAWLDGSGGAGRNLVRFEDEEYQRAVERARAWLQRNEESATRAVLIFDGFVTVDGQRTDALVLEATSFGARPCAWTLVVRYRPGGAARLAVGPPALLSGGAEGAPAGRIDAGFTRGVAQHPQGGVWRRHLAADL